MSAQNPQALSKALREAASQQGIDLTKPASAFLVCREDPQGGWFITPVADYMKAEELARQRPLDVYVLPVDTRHGLMKFIGNKLESIK